MDKRVHLDWPSFQKAFKALEAKGEQVALYDRAGMRWNGNQIPDIGVFVCQIDDQLWPPPNQLLTYHHKYVHERGYFQVEDIHSDRNLDLHDLHDDPIQHPIGQKKSPPIWQWGVICDTHTDYMEDFFGRLYDWAQDIRKRKIADMKLRESSLIKELLKQS